ncbi:hypothetical protein [Glutamicibacter ardleyensis]|uniref:hypothetical protein n=1 Tax=Glutamicibacter ardleyensis TaxID=225894 RepID=UPI003FD0D2D3
MESIVELEQVEVLFTESGKPFKVRRGGRVWSVAVEPTVHFSRVRWWEHGRRIPRGSGTRIDYAVWLVQVRLGSNERSELVSWELVEDTWNNVWRVR